MIKSNPSLQDFNNYVSFPQLFSVNIQKISVSCKHYKKQTRISCSYTIFPHYVPNNLNSNIRRPKVRYTVQKADYRTHFYSLFDSNPKKL